MGAYYPQGRYYSTPGAYEQQVGCHPPSSQAVAAAKKHKKHKKHRRHKKKRKKKLRA
jgi:hypothetical protein